MTRNLSSGELEREFAFSATRPGFGSLTMPGAVDTQLR